MERKIKAKFSNGVIKPLEKLDVEEGKELTITIEETPSEARKTIETLRNSFGAWKGTVDCESLLKDIYESRQLSTKRPEVKL